MSKMEKNKKFNNGDSMFFWLSKQYAELCLKDSSVLESSLVTIRRITFEKLWKIYRYPEKYSDFYKEVCYLRFFKRRVIRIVASCPLFSEPVGGVNLQQPDNVEIIVDFMRLRITITTYPEHVKL